MFSNYQARGSGIAVTVEVNWELGQLMSVYCTDTNKIWELCCSGSGKCHSSRWTMVTAHRLTRESKCSHLFTEKVLVMCCMFSLDDMWFNLVPDHYSAAKQQMLGHLSCNHSEPSLRAGHSTISSVQQVFQFQLA